MKDIKDASQKISLNTPVTTNKPIRKIMPTIHKTIFISLPFTGTFLPILGK